MNLADKETLDQVNNRSSRLGVYSNIVTTTMFNGARVDAHQYYLLSGNKILCDNTKVSISQSHGSPTRISSGYEITDTGYTFVIPNSIPISEMVYSIV